jgi:hypothetical protein
VVRVPGGGQEARLQRVHKALSEPPRQLQQLRLPTPCQRLFNNLDAIENRSLNPHTE